MGLSVSLQCHAETAAKPNTGFVPAAGAHTGAFTGGKAADGYTYSGAAAGAPAGAAVGAPTGAVPAAGAYGAVGAVRAPGDYTYTAVPAATFSDAQAKAELAKAVDATTVVRKGKAFPAPHTASTNSKTGACTPTDTQSFDHAASITIASPNHTKKDLKYPDPEDREFYSAPPGWVVQSYARHVDTSGPPFTGGDSSTPANFSWNNSSSYSSVQTQMHSYVASLNIPDVIKADLNAKIDSMISNISSASYSISSSSAVLTHHGQVSGVGTINPHTGHSWYTAWLNGTLACAPEYLYDANALTTMLKSWVTNTLSHTVHYSNFAAVAKH
jgi:hypothetical protein